MSETSKNNNSSPAKRRTGFINSIWADVTAGVLTVASGVVAARNAINETFYQNIKIIPEIGGSEEQKRIIRNKADKFTAAELKEIDGEFLLSAAEHRNIFHKIREASAAEKNPLGRKLFSPQNKEHTKRLEKILSDKYGINNTVDKLAFLRSHQKKEVFTKVGMTMAVTLGAVASVAALREISNDQKDLDARLDTIEANEKNYHR